VLHLSRELITTAGRRCPTHYHSTTVQKKFPADYYDSERERERERERENLERVPKMETWRETCKEPTFLSENKREFQFSTKFRKKKKTWLNRNGGINPKKKKKRE